MQNVVERATDVDVLGHILVDKREVGQGQQVLDVAHVPSDEVVHGNDLEPVPHEAVTQVRPEKPGCTRDEHALGGCVWSVLCHGWAS